MKLPQVVLIEDCVSDVYLIRETIRELKLEVELNVINRFEEAMASAADGNLHGFDALLIDIDLGTGSGLDVLKTIRSLENGRKVPIAIVTSSDSPRDRDAAMKLGATLFVRKPIDYSSFVNDIGSAIQNLVSSRNN